MADLRGIWLSVSVPHGSGLHLLTVLRPLPLLNSLVQKKSCIDVRYKNML